MRTPQASKQASIAYVISPLVRLHELGGSISPCQCQCQWFSGNVSHHAFPVERVRYATISSTTITMTCESCRLILRRFSSSIEVGVDDFLRVPLGAYVHCGWSTSLAGPSVPGEQGVWASSTDRHVVAAGLFTDAWCSLRHCYSRIL
jgi:hypothetical protein